jgi:hypothetical protein
LSSLFYGNSAILVSYIFQVDDPEYDEILEHDPENKEIHERDEEQMIGDDDSDDDDDEFHQYARVTIRMEHRSTSEGRGRPAACNAAEGESNLG